METYFKQDIYVENKIYHLQVGPFDLPIVPEGTLVENVGEVSRTALSIDNHETIIQYCSFKFLNGVKIHLSNRDLSDVNITEELYRHINKHCDNGWKIINVESRNTQ